MGFRRERALPFTALQPRLSRKRVTAAMRAEAPVVYMAFDVLLEGEELMLQSSLRVRRARLEEWVTAGVHPSMRERWEWQVLLCRDRYLQPRQLQTRAETRQG